MSETPHTFQFDGTVPSGETRVIGEVEAAYGFIEGAFRSDGGAGLIFYHDGEYAGAAAARIRPVAEAPAPGEEPDFRHIYRPGAKVKVAIQNMSGEDRLVHLDARLIDLPRWSSR
jgi:hypothetical protein